MFVATGCASAEICVKKSRFLSELFAVSSAAEAKAIVKAQKEKYADASHVVHAFSAGFAAETLGSNDAGEPSGTAGEPTLNALRRFPLTNALITTTRWFGGTLLGTGGLSRAYSDAAQAVLQAATAQGLICEYVEKIKFSLELAYSDLQKAEKILCDFGGKAFEKEFSEKVRMTCECAKSKKNSLFAQILEFSAGQAKISEIC